jgi:hypothetical protein
MTRFTLDQIPRLRWLHGPVGRAVVAAGLFGICLIAIAIAFNRSAARETLDDLSAVPMPIITSLPIAANAAANDRSVLRLACVEGNRLVLILRAKLAVAETYYTAGAEGHAEIFVGDRRNRMETQMTLVRRKQYDTLVSAKLSGLALNALGTFLGDTAPPHVTVATFRTTTELTGQAGKGQIATFVDECR